jgi:hypothetical protein
MDNMNRNPEEKTLDRNPLVESKIPLNLPVRALLVARKIKQIDIATQYNIHASEINRVLNGSRKTPHIRRVIAKVLEMSVEDLWKD